MNDPLTKAQLIEVLDEYIKPAYELFGAILAFTIFAIILFVIFGGTRKLWNRLIG